MEWLTRTQIDAILKNLSADDLIESMGEDAAKMPTAAFNRSATRLGIEKATEHVQASDYMYLVKAIGEAVNVESPLSEATASSPDSAISGG